MAANPLTPVSIKHAATFLRKVDPAIGFGAWVGKGGVAGAGIGAVLGLTTKDENYIGGAIGIGGFMGLGGSMLAFPFTNKYRNATGQNADIKWFRDNHIGSGITPEKFDAMPRETQLAVADFKLISPNLKIHLLDYQSYGRVWRENGGTKGGEGSQAAFVKNTKDGKPDAIYLNEDEPSVSQNFLHEVGHAITKNASTAQW